MAKRAIVYIDGFNLYFGLKERGWRQFYWLDMALLAANLLHPDEQLIATKYFTARISGPPDKRKRQATFLEATQTLGKAEMYFGEYLSVPYTCPNCGTTRKQSKEKMTDVLIGVEMVADAADESFDRAILVSADSDLSAAIEKVRKMNTACHITVAFPPRRASKRLRQVAHGSFTIGRGKFAKSLLPAQVVKPDGFVLTCPSHWGSTTDSASPTTP
ncbi:MAG: hypothetical protein Kow00129_16830 [Thermoleophilia bacterium]